MSVVSQFDGCDWFLKDWRLVLDAAETAISDESLRKLISVSITKHAHSHCGFMSGIVPIDAVIVKSVVFGQSGSMVVANVGMQIDRSSS